MSEALAGETGARRSSGALLITPEHAEWPQWPFAAFSLTGQRELAPPLALWSVAPACSPGSASKPSQWWAPARPPATGAHVAGDFSAGLQKVDGHLLAHGWPVGRRRVGLRQRRVVGVGDELT
jgi:DNA processing protein